MTDECASTDYLLVQAGELVEMRVIDTIGLQDTDLPAAEVVERFSKFSDLVPCGIDVFLFVVRWGRFKPEHEAALDAFAANCGEVALRHTLLVFTHCSESAEGLERVLTRDAPASLREWAAKAGGAVAVDNVLAAPEGRAALHDAIERLCATNKEHAYSNDALAEARRRHDARQEEERAAFSAAVADWRKGSGPVVVEREYEPA